MSAKYYESRLLLSPAPLDVQKVSGDSGSFILTDSAATLANTTQSLTSNRMKQPTELATLDLHAAINSGKTLVGNIAELVENTQQGRSKCHDDQKKDYWMY